MAKKGSWYFEGYEAHYEIDENGKKKKVLEYVGQYYGLKNADLRRVRLLVTADILLLTAVLLLINFLPGTIGMIVWVGAPCLWALVPLIFLYMGLFNFLTCKDKWEIRQFYAGYRRIRRSALAMLILMAYVTAAHVVFQFLIPGTFPGELPYTIGALICALLAAGLLLIQRRYPAVVVQGPTIR